MRLFYWVNGIFITINSVFLIHEFFWFTALPLVLLVIIISFLRIDILLLAITFFTPLSVNVRDIGMGFGISLPSEPLMMLLLCVFGLKVLLTGGYNRKILTHPVSILIALHLLWMGITSISSTMPFVSFKFFLSRIWFVCLFYFLGVPLFSTLKNIKFFIWLFCISLTVVILYTIRNHYFTGFNEKAAHWVMDPFFNDHTSYAAVIVMFIPSVLYFLFDKTQHGIARGTALSFLVLFVLAIILSYTRAAWLSIAFSFFVFLIFILKIKFRTLLIASIALITLFLSFQTEIFQKLEQNRQDSSKDISRHLKSISNISTDASNLERINRWHSAWRMFLSKPIAGFGPGTYQFKYAPFQHSNEKTIISTNSGTKGTAHSEYLGPMAEQGGAGSLLFLLIIASVSFRTVKLFSATKQKEIKPILLCVFLGLVSYFIHGLMNNFLDTDKASVPFWGFIAILVALDIKNSEEESASSEQEAA